MTSPSLSSCTDPSPPSGGELTLQPGFLDEEPPPTTNQSEGEELVEIITLGIDDDSDFLHGESPPSNAGGILRRSLSATSRMCRKLQRISSAPSSSTTTPPDPLPPSVRKDHRKAIQRSGSSAERALRGLRFINTSSERKGTTESDSEELWRRVESRFESLAKDGLLSRDDFGECVGMADSKEFARCTFDALARRRRPGSACGLTKEELRGFWLAISDDSFDARLQIFFDMADTNGDGKITRDEVQELIMLSASANKLCKLKEHAREYALLIMEELDPEGVGYIELWQLETLLLKKDTYMNYRRSLTTSGEKNATLTRPHTLVSRFFHKLIRRPVLEKWRRGWILALWLATMACLFGWKFDQYKRRVAFRVTGYCLPVAKGAAETLKLNMALVLLPVCRNSLTWLRSIRAMSVIPLNDHICFHKMVAGAIAAGVIVHGGVHLFCDFPRLTQSSPSNFAIIASDFREREPTYEDLLRSVAGVTGLCMVTLMVIAFTLATGLVRRNLVSLPPPFNRLTGFNAFWYSHHLLGLVYVLLLVHGSFLFLVHKWYQKTTWMYVSAPLLLYVVERGIRSCRSRHYSSVSVVKVSVLPGNVFSLTISKPRGFNYTSGQYLLLKCPDISPLEWHPFSLSSAPDDGYLRVHIRSVGDWTEGLKRLLSEVPVPPNATAQSKQPKLYIDGPYGAPAQDYHKYEVLLLVGLGIGATPFISILRDLANNARTAYYRTDSNTESIKSDESMSSYPSSSSTFGGKRRTLRTTTTHFVWVTRDPGSLEWFKEVLDEVAEMDHKGHIEMHSYLTSVYKEGDARSTLITVIQALKHAKHGVDIFSGTRLRTHLARPNWKELFEKIASRHPLTTVGVFYCGKPILAKELKKLCQTLNQMSSTRFEFHKEHF